MAHHHKLDDVVKVKVTGKFKIFVNVHLDDIHQLLNLF